MALSSAVAGCGSDVKGKIACTDDTVCTDVASKLYNNVDASPEQLPTCCSGSCVTVSLGCESGYRYFTSAPGVGDCVATDPMCPGVTRDMSMELPDLKMPPEQD